MAKLIKEANRIITLWRNYGPNQTKLDLEKIFYEIVIPSSNGDRCKIVREPFDSFEGLMARLDDSSEWKIGVSTNIDYQPRRNYTLAHEIGHFIGHRFLRNIFQCTFENLNDFQSEQLETEANEFASHLLMPPDVIRKFDQERIFDCETISELAALFGVSKEAAAYRWIALSIRKIGFVMSRDGMVNKGRSSAKLFSLGVFFKNGQELPGDCFALRLSPTTRLLNEIVPQRIWHEFYPCHESSYATAVNGYIYTYLDFDRC